MMKWFDILARVCWRPFEVVQHPPCITLLTVLAFVTLQAVGQTGSQAAVGAGRPGRRPLRPILMTALAAITGMLPLAFALGAGSQMLQPLAIAVIGDLLTSMVRSLIVTPVVYFRLTRNRSEAIPG
jgi:multidrug efflux pump subunit AcrB